jgi:hypothetical protein
LIFEAFVRHDVAPMTGRIADRQKDRLALSFGFGERVGSPSPPVDRIVLMLKKVGAGLAGQSVLTLRGSGVGHKPRIFLERVDPIAAPSQFFKDRSET